MTSPKNRQNRASSREVVFQKEIKNYCVTVGSRIVAARQALGLSQDKLVEKIDRYYDGLTPQDKIKYDTKGKFFSLRTLQRLESGQGKQKARELVMHTIEHAWQQSKLPPLRWYEGGQTPEKQKVPGQMEAMLKEMLQAIRGATTLQCLNYMFDKYHSDQTRRDLTLLRIRKTDWGEANDEWAKRWGELKNAKELKTRKGADELDAARRRIFSMFYRIRLLVLADYLAVDKAFTVFGGFSAAIPRVYLHPLAKIITAQYDKGFFEFWEAVENGEWKILARQVTDARTRRTKFEVELRGELPEFFV